MKTNSLFLLCALALLPTLAFAGAPGLAPKVVESEVDAKEAVVTSGHLDAILTACIKADAANRAFYEKLRGEFIVFREGTSQQIKVQGSGTPEYKAAYDQVAVAVAKVSHEDLMEGCKSVFSIGKQDDAK